MRAKVKSDIAGEAGGGRGASACCAAGVGAWSNGVAQRRVQCGSAAAWGRAALLVRRAFDCLVESWQALRRRGLAGRCPPGPRPLDGDGLPLMALGESPPVTRCSSPAARGVSGSKH